jgi:hypothetical protein
MAQEDDISALGRSEIKHFAVSLTHITDSAFQISPLNIFMYISLYRQSFFPVSKATVLVSLCPSTSYVYPKAPPSKVSAGKAKSPHLRDGHYSLILTYNFYWVEIRASKSNRIWAKRVILKRKDT